MRRRLALPALVALAGCGGSEPAPTTVATATTPIVRQDLVETETVDGTLGYADEQSVAPRLKGTTTWTPEAGAVIRPNHRLTEVDGRGVYLYLINGRGLLNGRSVSTGDAAKITGPETITFSAADACELILVEVPLRFEAVGVWKGR